MKITAAYFEITNRCNLNCTTCYNRSGLNKNHMEIPLHQLKKSIEILLDYGVNRIIFSGGEPTLHNQFEDILELINEYPLLSFGIVTNGTIHNSKLIHMLNTNKNLTLQISLDGSNEQKNSKIRGKGHFDKVAQLIGKIHSAYTKPLLKMVVSQSNYEDAKDFYRFAVSIGCIPEYAFAYKLGSACDEWDKHCLSAQQKLSVLNCIDLLNTQHNLEAVLPLCISKCPYVDGAENLFLCIKVDGAIQPCQMLYDPTYSVGNIFYFNPKEFRSNIFKIISLAQARSKADFGCAKCILKDSCMRGCMASAVNLHSNPLGEDGECTFRKFQFLGYTVKKVVNRNMQT